jgi:pseudouridine-5'-phosphate glycosidase
MPVSKLTIAPSVREALAAGRPVVALESTVISHGLPFPENLAIALEMEEAVAASGALPATIAVLGGQITVGLSEDQIEQLARRHQVVKCSRRDIPVAVARKLDGGTTVAGTMVVAQLAGIRVFATGGIGGVHRNHPHDISADLYELARTRVCVVSAGAKSLLDLPATLEVLETHSVPVVGYGTTEFPAFFARSSGLPVMVRADSPAEVADLLQAQDALGYQCGMLVGVPVPAAEALPGEEVEVYIEKAIRRAESKGITGPAVTPFLLSQIAELSGGRSVTANRALLLNNSRVAAKIAAVLAGSQDL